MALTRHHVAYIGEDGVHSGRIIRCAGQLNAAIAHRWQACRYLRPGSSGTIPTVNTIGERGHVAVAIGGNLNISDPVIGRSGDGHIIPAIVCGVVLEKAIGGSGEQIAIGIENQLIDTRRSAR